MANLNQIYEKAKIQVDVFNITPNCDYVCSCYTPGANEQIEPEYLVKTISQDEIIDHLKPRFGNTIDVIDYMVNEGYSHEMCIVCSEIINKREQRTYTSADLMRAKFPPTGSEVITNKMVNEVVNNIVSKFKIA